MLFCRPSVVRRTVKISTVAGEVPTIPDSDNHQDGSWISTDIYIGEFFFNSADGVMYTRSENGINVVGQNNPNGIVKIYIALISQSSTDAPTAIELVNTYTGAITYQFDGDGEYSVHSAAGEFTVNLTSFQPPHVWGFVKWAQNNENSIGFETRNTSNTHNNGMLANHTIIITTYPEPPSS